MGQYMITYLGGEQPSTPEEGQRHFAKYKEWLSALGEAAVSPANPIMGTRTVNSDGSVTAGGTTSMSGYTIVEAESIEAAVEMAKACSFLEIGGFAGGVRAAADARIGVGRWRGCWHSRPFRQHLVRSRGSRVSGLATVLVAWPGPASASDFYALIVVFVAFGISGVLCIQALIGIVLVMDGRYRAKDPVVFICVAMALFLVGSLMVLDEAGHLEAEDLSILFSALVIPAMVAIVPPLLQRGRGKRSEDPASR